MVEARTISAELIGQIEPNLKAHLPKYKRSTPEERSREMQAAAFGAIEHVSDGDCQELVGNVQTIRAWLEEHGKTAEEHPEYKGTEHKVQWVKDEEDPQAPYISVEPELWDQQSGRNFEPYPKFTVESTVAGSRIQFELNFDDTYYLSISKGNGAISFVSSHLPRREMTKQENAIVKAAISQATSHYGVSL